MDTISFKKVTIIEGSGTDKIYLETDHPEGCYPFKGNMTLRFDVAAGTARDYLLVNMNIRQFEAVNVNGEKIVSDRV